MALGEPVRGRIQQGLNRRFVTIPPNFRKSHVINSAVGAGTGYQVRIVAHKGTGIDSGEDVYLGTNIRDDFGDVRFTASDGNSLLAYWLESKVDGDNAIFHVKIADDLSIKNREIYLYYGKSDATSISNVDNTFLFGDDLELGNLSKWTIAGSDWSCQSEVKKYGTYAARAVRTGSGDARLLRKDLSSLSLSKGKVIFWARAEDATTTHYIFAPKNDADSDMYLLAMQLGNFRYSKPGVGWLPLPVITLYTPGVFYKIQICWNYATGKYDVWIDDAKKSGTGITDTLIGTFLAKPQAASAFDHGLTTYLDHYVVAKFVDPEPTHGSWGKEERAEFPS